MPQAPKPDPTPSVMACLLACLLALAVLTSPSFAQVVEELPKPIKDPNPLRIIQSIQKSELQMDREVSPEKSKGRFTLVLDNAIERNLQILPSPTQELLGPSRAQWRIRSENFAPEIVLTLQSKPASRWQVSCTVQVPSLAQGPLIELGPKDPESVLRRLKAYDHWLKSTVEQWKVAPTNPPNFRTARSYAARQKETQQSLERWSQIEQLASQVFDAARVEFELTPVMIEAP